MNDSTRNSATYKATPERLPHSPEALFLLEGWLHELDEVKAVMAAETTTHLAFITTARQQGAASDVTTSLLNASIGNELLDEWHVRHGRLSPEGRLLYRGGLLFGIKFAQIIHRRLFGEDMVATSLPAYDAALDFVQDSYLLPQVQAASEAWRQTAIRERQVVGSDILSLMGATLHSHFVGLLSGVGGRPPDSQDGYALHNGFVDALTFFSAYRDHAQGCTPAFWGQPQEYFPLYDASRHYVLGQPEVFDSHLNLQLVLDSQRRMEDKANWPRLRVSKADVSLSWLGYLLGKGRVRRPVILVQVGPHLFQQAIVLRGHRRPETPNNQWTQPWPAHYSAEMASPLAWARAMLGRIGLLRTPRCP